MTQLMDQGVIRALKAYHCSSIVKRQLKFIDAGKEVVNVNILDAMCMLMKFWNAASPGSVVNYIRKAGIS